MQQNAQEMLITFFLIHTYNYWIICVSRLNSIAMRSVFCLRQLPGWWGGGGVLPYMGYIGMCGPKGYGFSAVLVINRVSILADFGHFGHK